MSLTEPPPTQPPANAGTGRRRPPRTPKGRQVDPQAVADIESLLTDRSRRRDLLIEHLHLIQDATAIISARIWPRWRQEMKLALTEVYEVATFYAHFDVVKEGETPPPPVTVRVCDLLSCAHGRRRAAACRPAEDAWRGCARGARALHGRLRSRAGLRRRPCASHGGRRGERRRGELAHVHTHAQALSDARHRFRRLCARRAAIAFSARLLDGKRTRDDMIKIVSDAGLRGLGGAGFPTGRKWSLVRAEPAPRLMAVNADEGEPGTFKDRYYLERDPHRFIEGMLIAAWVVEAAETYLYIRDEYPELRLMLVDEIAKVEKAGLERTPRFICAAAPALISAAKNRR